LNAVTNVDSLNGIMFAAPAAVTPGASRRRSTTRLPNAVVRSADASAGTKTCAASTRDGS
jgi:hypothetical protein